VAFLRTRQWFDLRERQSVEKDYPALEFRYPYILAMQEQNRKLLRWLRDSGELDAFLEMKAREASRIT